MFAYTAAKHEAETNKDLVSLAALQAPEILQDLWTYQRFEWKHLPWPGGLEDQPFLYMYELDCAEEALALQRRLEQAQAAVVAAAAAAQTP